jgi:hypothetical protein
MKLAVDRPLAPTASAAVVFCLSALRFLGYSWVTLHLALRVLR